MYALKLGQSLVSSNRIGVANDFVFTVLTNAISGSAPSPAKKFQLPMVNVGNTNFVVEWGDGTKDTITTYNAAETLHEYSVDGTYTIKIRGDYAWKFANVGDKAKMRNIETWGGFNFKTSQVFWSSTVTSTATDYALVSTTNFQSCFRTNTFNGVLNELDVSNVTNFQSCFFGASVFNQPLNSWNTSSATRMDYMFNNAVAFDQDISSWDITSVTNLSNFMTGVTLSTINYDALLIAWEAQAPNTGITVDFGSSEYSLGSSAATARANLISTYSWTITDGGGI